VAEQHGIRLEREHARKNLARRHRPELGIQQTDVVTVVDQRSADREQPERRQVIVGNPAADRRMRHIDEEDAHCRGLALED
jgi:hypothetical protein